MDPIALTRSQSTFSHGAQSDSPTLSAKLGVQAEANKGQGLAIALAHVGVLRNFGATTPFTLSVSPQPRQARTFLCYVWYSLATLLVLCSVFCLLWVVSSSSMAFTRLRWLI